MRVDCHGEELNPGDHVHVGRQVWFGSSTYGIVAGTIAERQPYDYELAVIIGNGVKYFKPTLIEKAL